MKILSLSSSILAATVCLIANPVPANDSGRGVRAMMWTHGHDISSLFEIGPDDRFPDGLPLYLWQGDAETTKIVVPFNTISTSIPFPEGDELVLFQRPFASDDPDHPPPVAARVSIPPDRRHALAILVPRGALLDRRFNLLVLDDSPNYFPPNSIRFINLSGEPVEVALGDKRLVVAAASQTIEPMEVQNNSVRLIVAKTIPESGRPQVITRNLRTYDGVRVTCFLYTPGGAAGHLRLRILSENVTTLDL